MTAPDSVRAFLVAHVSDRLAAIGVDPEHVTDDLDLVAEGVLDSLGLIELIAAMEARFGVELDFEGLDAGSFGVVGPFSRHISEQLSPTTSDR